MRRKNPASRNDVKMNDPVLSLITRRSGRRKPRFSAVQKFISARGCAEPDRRRDEKHRERKLDAEGTQRQPTCADLEGRRGQVPHESVVIGSHWFALRLHLEDEIEDDRLREPPGPSASPAGRVEISDRPLRHLRDRHRRPERVLDVTVALVAILPGWRREDDPLAVVSRPTGFVQPASQSKHYCFLWNGERIHQLFLLPAEPKVMVPEDLMRSVTAAWSLRQPTLLASRDSVEALKNRDFSVSMAERRPPSVFSGVRHYPAQMLGQLDRAEGKRWLGKFTG